jgi:hypothetical protein
MVDHVFQHHKAIARKRPGCNFEVALVEPPAFYFVR